MKVIILAGGWGSRLGSLTESIPKPMVRIGNKPILWHIMKTYSFYGFNDFVIALGVKGNEIKNYFYNFDLNNSDLSIDFPTKKIKFHNSDMENRWNVTLVDTGLNTLKGGRIKRLEKYLLGNETHMITYGDCVANIDINELFRFHESHGKTITITGVHPPARFGELIEEKGVVTSFEEKPQISTGLINGGYMVFNNSLLKHLTSDEDCDFEFNVLEKLSKEGEVMAYKHNGFWECMDHERDVVYLNRLWDKGQASWKVW